MTKDIGDGYTVKYNFCESPLPAEGTCTDSDAYAFVMGPSGECVAIRNEEKKTNIFATELVDENNMVNGFTLNYPGEGTTCLADSSKTYSFKVELTCGTNEGLATEGVSSDPCQILLQYKSKQGCSVFSYDQLMVFLTKYSWLWGAALILAGIFVGFFGNTLVNAVIMLVGSIAAAVILVGLIFTVITKTSLKISDGVRWGILGVAGLISIAIGYLLMRLRKYGIALLCAWGGVMLGLILSTTFMVENKGAYYAIIVGSGLILLLFGLKFEVIAIKMVTSFLGAYGVVRGISLYAGGFPNEATIADEIKSGVITADTFPKSFYGYGAGIIVLTIICFYFQSTHGKKI